MGTDSKFADHLSDLPDSDINGETSITESEARPTTTTLSPAGQTKSAVCSSLGDACFTIRIISRCGSTSAAVVVCLGSSIDSASRRTTDTLGEMPSDRLTLALDEFQQNLSPDQKNEFDSIASSSPNVQDVVLLTQEIDQKNSERKSRIMANRMSGVLESVQQYCVIIDTFVQSNPGIAALVWGSVKFVILTASNFSSYFEKLSERFAQLGTYCPRLREYEKLFKNSVRFRNSLSNFYAVIIMFCTKALAPIQEKGIKRFAKSVWKSFKSDFGLLEENLSAAKDEVDAEIKLASEQEAHHCRELQLIEFKENQFHRSQHSVEIQESRLYRSQQLVEANENQLFRSQQMIALAEAKELRVQKVAREEERYRIRLHQMVYIYDYTWSLRRARRIRCQGTGFWFFERVDFKEWSIGELPGCLWCSGIPGCGKTILTNNDVFYYFFDFSRKESLSAVTFLQSLLHQLIRSEILSPDIQRFLEAIFGPNGNREPDTGELEALIIRLCGKLGNVFFIIDGIDEVEQNERRVVLRFLKNIGQSRLGIQFFIAAQPEVDMTAVFGNPHAVRLRPDDLQTDIKVFIDYQIENEYHGVLSICGPELIKTIKHVLATKAQGMFLWVDLQIRAISDTCEQDGTPHKIPKLLDNLPHGITEIYSRALQKLVLGDDERTKMAKKMFQCVVCARRPMTINELEEAATIATSQKVWKQPSIKLSLSTLSKLCGNLIAFNEFDSVVSLAHHTVLLFLQSCFNIPSIANFHFQPYEADRFLGEVCITYFNFADFEKAITTTSDTRNLQYLNSPMSLAARILPGFKKVPIGLWNWNQRLRQPLGFNPEYNLRNILASTRPAKVDPRFQLLEYCIANWYHHCVHFNPEDTRNFANLQKLVLDKQLPFNWRPWAPPDDLDPFPHWAMFNWASQLESCLQMTDYQPQL
ncbi:hypothetical protein K440DRAFT_658299 [Wilcoxina mikolae CBS 423.85]|nr:hypothetical protein K440DRAFT_658299 [Wilcoxina mikolae CBS 423.85]